MTDQRIAEITARCEAATPGPWGTHENHLIKIINTGYNAGFIAHAREDIPYLLSQLAAKDAEIERMRLVCDLAAYVKDTILDRVSKTAGRMTVSQDLYFAVKRLGIALRHVLPAAPEEGKQNGD